MGSNPEISTISHRCVFFFLFFLNASCALFFLEKNGCFEKKKKDCEGTL